ncbi:MAG: hypothetical protein HY720_30855 [Planctomycetes bacterium]|nr:hypothetical protein [Planctomycetota bacterium]
MNGGPLEPADLSGVRRYSIAGRKSLVSREDFVRLVGPEATAAELVQSFPDILVGREFKALAARIARAVQSGAKVGLALGAHVIKCGLSPLVIDLMERGIVHGVALHGAGAIHDLELARAGETSEDVAAGVVDGSFGMAAETGDAMNAATRRAARERCGLGRAVGREILESGAPYSHLSILAAATRLDLPATVFVAIGTDIVHMHPGVDAAALGEASYLDFRLLVSFVQGLGGGVWLNVGSAVILPEVFLKAVNVARNLGSPVADLATADLDMLRHYRPRVNVCERPVRESYRLTGHHEILLPLLRVAILANLRETPG